MSNILEFIYCMFYVCSITLCVYPFLNRKIRKMELIVFIFFYAFIDYIITQNIVFNLHVYYLQSILVIISDFLMICLLNRKFEIYLFFYTLMFYNIFNCSVIFINYSLNYFSEFHILWTLQPSILRFSLVIIFNVISVLVFRLLYKYKVIADKSIIRVDYQILIFINLSVQIAYIVFDWLNKMEYINEYMHIILLIFITLWILLLYALNHVFILNEEKTRTVFMNGIYENIEQYIKYYQRDEERIRKIRHDMKNHFTIIRALKGDENIHQYIDKVYPELDNLRIINTNQSGNIYVDAIINCKRLQYPSVELNCQCCISQLNMNDVDLSMLLFNLIDNACQAAEKVNGKVELDLKYIEPHLLIIIDNSKKGSIDFHSQKGKEHGYGMKIINEIVDKYKGKIDYHISEKEVKTSIIMLINNAN